MSKTNNLNFYHLLVMLSVLSGCALSNTAKPININNENHIYGTYLFQSECITTIYKTEESPPFKSTTIGGEVVAILISNVVKTGINWIGTRLEEAAKDSIEPTSVQLNVTSKDDLNNKCLQVIRAQFRPMPSREDEFSGYKRVALETIDGTEELFIELLPILKGNLVAFTPLQVRYNGYTPRDNQNKKPRDLAIAIGYLEPKDDISIGFTESQTINSRLIQFGTLDPRNQKMATVKFTDDKGNLTLINQAQWMEMPTSTENTPFTIVAKVIETREAGALIKALSTAFSASKDGINTKLDQAIISSDIFKSSAELQLAKLDSAKAYLALEDTYYKDVLAAKQSKVKLEEVCATAQPTSNEIYAAKTEHYLKTKKANLTASQINKKQPFENIAEPNGTCP